MNIEVLAMLGCIVEWLAVTRAQILRGSWIAHDLPFRSHFKQTTCNIQVVKTWDQQ